MKDLVRRGYASIEYEQQFRPAEKPDAFEQKFLDGMLRRLPAQAAVLDLGCGPGIPYDQYLVEKGCDLTGVDFCRRHLELARQNVPRAAFIEGDFTALGFAPASFDAVVSFYAVFHVPRAEHQALFDGIHRLLKPGGLVLLTLGTRDSAYGEETDWLGAPMAWSMFTPEAYKKMLAASGFDLINEAFEGQPEDGEHHFWVLAGR